MPRWSPVGWPGARSGRLAAVALTLTLAALAVGCSDPVDPDGVPPPAADPAPSTPSGSGLVSGTVPVVAGGLASVVILMPTTPQAFDPQPAMPVMDQIDLTFAPSILLARTGQPVEFWNNDDVLHNVRVLDAVTKEPSFNVAIPMRGKYEYTFTRDAFYEVGCDIHPGMSAVVVASSTPYVAVTNREGQFTMHDVTPGTYQMTVYAGARTIEHMIEVTGPETTIALD